MTQEEKFSDTGIYIVADKDTIVFSKDDIAQILMSNLSSVENKMKKIILDYADKIVKDVADGAYDAARKGYFWNQDMFKELMKETIYEMFFAQPETNEKFTQLIETSFKKIVENWLQTTLDGLSTKESFIANMKKIKKTKAQ